MRCCKRGGIKGILRSLSKDFKPLSDDKEEEKDWKLDDLKEIDERLSDFIKNAGAPPFEGTNFI